MRKRMMILISAVLSLIILVTAVALPALALEPEPTPKRFGWHRGRGGLGRGLCGEAGLDGAAEVLGMTAEELSTQLEGGTTLADLADEAGVELQTIRDAVEAACEAARVEAIEQAVEDGDLTQDHADWLLEGIEKGFVPGLSGFGRGMRGRFGGFAPSSGRSSSAGSTSL